MVSFIIADKLEENILAVTLDGLGSFGTRKLELISVTSVRGM